MGGRTSTAIFSVSPSSLRAYSRQLESRARAEPRSAVNGASVPSSAGQEEMAQPRYRTQLAKATLIDIQQATANEMLLGGTIGRKREKNNHEEHFTARMRG